MALGEMPDDWLPRYTGVDLSPLTVTAGRSRRKRRDFILLSLIVPLSLVAVVLFGCAGFAFLLAWWAL